MCIRDSSNIGDIAEATGLPAEKIRVVENPTGGTFGWGIAAATYAMAAIACMACDGMPVALSIDYGLSLIHILHHLLTVLKPLHTRLYT